ncbi:Global transcription regulator sge1 [Rhodotorula kratochvilovae]
MADPAFRGFVESTLDALLIFEGCKRGFLPKITRRLQEFEKRALVVSGAVFVFDEEETGIKRWTDGLSWSPSRTLGNFLVYRELDKKAPLSSGGGVGDDDDGEGGGGGGSIRSRLMGGLTSKADPVDEQDAASGGPVASGSGTRPGSSSARQRAGSDAASAALDRARERALVGSLTSSYRFRSDGLVKKTISLQGLHLIGYYRIDDVVSGRLRTPSSHQELNSIEVSSHFLAPSLYRIPPLVDVGADGQLKYKGEADAPMSPLTRSGSSQGFPTPGLNQSRPASSSNAPEAFGAVLTPGGAGWDYTTLPAPGSPRRSVTAGFRSINRFDPYSSARFSPTHQYPPHTAAGYPFPPIPSNQPPPRTAFPPIGESAYEGSGGDFYQARTPPVDAVSTSAPLANGGWGGPQGAPAYQHGPPPSGAGEYGADGLPPPGTAFYQPRHSVPYAPTSDASGSNAIFAYNPPPPAAPGYATHAPQYRVPHTATGAPVYAPYQPYGAPAQHALSQTHLPTPGSAPGYPPQLSPTSEAHSQSPFATPPSTAHAVRAPYPGVLNLSHPASAAPSQGSSSHSSPVPPLSGYAPHARTTNEPTRSLAGQAASLMSEVSPHSPADALGDSRMQHQQQQALQSMYPPNGGGGYAPPQQGSYRPYDQPPAQYGYQHAQSHHQASGLVAAIANEEIVPASGHGLGVSAYGEIVPAAQAGGGPASSASSYGPMTSLRHPPPALPSVSLSSQHVYAPAPAPHTLYDGSAGRGGGGGGHGSPLGSHLAGVLDRDAGGRGAWMPKRETPDPHVLQQPLSPPMQPSRTPVLAPPPPPPQQQHQQGGQWWGGEDPWQQGVAARQPKEEYPAT